MLRRNAECHYAESPGASYSPYFEQAKQSYSRTFLRKSYARGALARKKLT